MHASVFRKVVSVAVAILSASVSFSPVTLLSQNSESPPEVLAGELQDGTEVPDSTKPPLEPEDIPPDATSSGVSMPQDMDGSIAPGAEPGGGKLNYQTDLFTGRFTYTVPIAVVPGRQGAQPSLALTYNSSGGNGWCGVGWGLEVGSIQRDTRKGVSVKWALPSPTPLQQYDDSKGFISSFGGVSSALVLVDSSNPNCHEYRQEVETAFLKYNFYPAGNYWEIIDKAGNKFFFGEAPASRMENLRWASTASAGRTFRWGLNRVLDVNGNQTTLTYQSDLGQLYLSRIAYNENINSTPLGATHSVDFLLSDRADRTTAFNNGYRVETRKLLSEVHVKVSGQNVRKYALQYNTSPSTLRSLLYSVTQYGTDFTTPLPATVFQYQQKPFAFAAKSDWVFSTGGETGIAWNSVRGVDGNNDTHSMLTDIDGDALPDRVLRASSAPFAADWRMHRNTGSGFNSQAVHNWGPLDSQGQTDSAWNSPFSINGAGATVVGLVDINGDFLPDRVMRSFYAPYTRYFIQTNTGLSDTGLIKPGHASFYAAAWWPGVINSETGDADWLSMRYKHSVDFLDINGDGLPDRISRKLSTPFNVFKVQFNTRSDFSSPVDWSPLSSQGQTGYEWNSPSRAGVGGNTYVMLADINGDGLPDRVMRNLNPPYTKFVVQFNNGAGFETAEDWGPVDTQSQSSSLDWGSPIGSDGQNVRATLTDLNGDGLLDRVMRVANTPYTKWVVQLNTGTGFAAAADWGPLDSQGQTSASWNNITYRNSDLDTVVDLLDINGDGLPDRVMRKLDPPHDRFIVQLNQGPYPDLLAAVENGIGGKVEVAYVPSTAWDNRGTNWTSDPVAEGARGLLPYPVYTVSRVSLHDGLGAVSDTTYAYKGGFYEPAKREFRGFAQVEVTDPMSTRTKTYFHQSGGRDDSALGEYNDHGSVAKKGIPYRVDLIGNDGVLNRITLNKVEEVQLHASGRFFPYLSQTLTLAYEGLASCRATAKQLLYDNTTGNLTKDISLGEVSNVNVQTHTFTDIGSDTVYTHTAYATGLGVICNKPSSIKVTSDSAGSTRLRETQFSYDSRGNLTTNRVWLDTTDSFISTSAISYDQYGNPVSVTDAAGITTRTYYDSAYKQFPTNTTTASFTNRSWFDYRSGAVLQAIDPNGLVTSNYYDIFFRPRETRISLTSNAAPTLWRTRIDYQHNGTSVGVSQNWIRTRRYDPLDPTNGLESYAYLDGLGRACQTKVEAETNGFRVSDTFFNARGQQEFQTVPRFSTNSGFSGLTTALGTYTEYDPVGRPFRVTPGVQLSLDANRNWQVVLTSGDTGSPLGAVSTAYKDGSNPWASVVTDPEGSVKKSFHDAYGRISQIAEVAGASSYTTSYGYDLLGNLTTVTDHLNNVTRIYYDSLGRKTSMTDPDMGAWSYLYDNAGRLTQQTDARLNVVKFFYNDPVGRMTGKAVFGNTGALAYASTNYYDSNYGDAACTVFKGQLYMATDREGHQKFSYDVRGRVLKSIRYVTEMGKQYVAETTYDDADRPTELTYPSTVTAKVRYEYDTAGNLVRVKSTAGTGAQQEHFYRPLGFNAAGQPLGVAYGNGLVTTNEYYNNSMRLKRLRTTGATGTHQDLTYTFDRVSNLKSIADAKYPSGPQSASISSISYDPLHRLTSLYSTAASATRGYTYGPTGNLLSNGEAGAGTYTYGAKPHAVTGAFGRAYGYDACGNMTTRGTAGGTQTLEYDEENRLSVVTGPGYAVAMGYDGAGERLWRYSTTPGSETVWIGGIYEERGGKQLCHVFAGGRRVATFEPQAGTYAATGAPDRWVLFRQHLDRAAAWPFQDGRAPWTVLVFAFAGLLGICAAARRQSGLAASGFRVRPAALWQQAVTLTVITSLLLATTESRVNAQSYNPVFYYYHPDHLGSSTVLTDRTGNRVDFYGYTAYGRQQYNEATPALPVSHRFTGQILDEETGLYYYGARYYDPELGRFIQADTIVPRATDPQMLNRYTYCGNNPLKYVDPSGHIFFLIPILAVAAVGALVGGAASAASGGSFWGGALSGALTAVGGSVGGPAGAAIGSAIGGMANAAISGGSGSQIVLAGVVSGLSAGIGFGVGNLVANATSSFAAQFAATTATGTLIGGVSSLTMGESFAEGAYAGAVGSAVGFTAGKAVQFANNAIQKARADAAAQKQQALATDLNSNERGKLGEKLAGINEGEKVDIPSATGTATHRTPDKLSLGTVAGSGYLEEVKYVQELIISGRVRQQLTDMGEFARTRNIDFIIRVRTDTIIRRSGTMEFIQQYNVRIIPDLPPPSSAAAQQMIPSIRGPIQ